MQTWWTTRLALIETRANAIRGVIAFAEDAIESHVYNLQSAWADSVDSEGEEELEALGMKLGDDLYEAEFVYAQTLRRALFLTVMSLFEVDLNEVCEDFARAESHSLRAKDLHGNGIERSKVYLKKVCAIPFPDDAKEWSLIKAFSELRNVVVHRGGVADLNRDSRIAAEFVSHDMIDLYEDHPVTFEEGFLDFVLDTLGRFWRDLNSAVAAAHGA